MLSGPAETGKTIAALHRLHCLCLDYPGAQCAIVRKVQADIAGTCLVTYQSKILLPANRVIPYGGKNPTRFIYPNGTVVWVGGMDNPGKVLSGERDFIYVNQAEELSLDDWETLTSRATGRAGNAPFAFVFGDCNPSSRQHWILARRAAGHLRILESFHRDNPLLFDDDGNITRQGEHTMRVLSRMTGVRLKRLYHGVWCSPEGAIYDIFDEERHKVAAFEVSRLWPRVVGIDPAGAYRAALWLAYDPKNQVVNVYRELSMPFGDTVASFARAMEDVTGGAPVFAWVCGAKSERDWRVEFGAAGVPVIEPPFVDVWVGIDRVYSMLRDYQLVIHDCCPKLLSEIGDYRRVLKNGEPTDAIENKDRYHMLDALRYAVAWLTQPAEEASVVYAPYRIGR